MHHEFFQLAQKVIANHSSISQALATVVQVRGSAYRREGTRMLIDEKGNWQGNISGGCLEGDIHKKALGVIRSGEAILVSYDTRESENKEIRMALGCNGIIDILIEPVGQEITDLCKSIIRLFEEERTAHLYTGIIWEDNHLSTHYELNEHIPEKYLDSFIKSENQCIVEKKGFTTELHEYLGLQRKLVIWGSGPDAISLTRFSNQMGWKTTVSNDCGLDKIKDKVGPAELIACNFEDFQEKISIHQNTAVLLVSHDYYKDYFLLEKVIRSEAKYIGIMGPKRRGERMLKEFKKRNPNVEFNKDILHYPVGLDIGSDNPVEIALSVIAEVQSVFSGKNALSLKDKASRIHDSLEDNTLQDFNPDNQVCTVNKF